MNKMIKRINIRMRFTLILTLSVIATLPVLTSTIGELEKLFVLVAILGVAHLFTNVFIYAPFNELSRQLSKYDPDTLLFCVDDITMDKFNDIVEVLNAKLSQSAEVNGFRISQLYVLTSRLYVPKAIKAINAILEHNHLVTQEDFDTAVASAERVFSSTACDISVRLKAITPKWAQQIHTDLCAELGAPLDVEISAAVRGDSNADVKKRAVYSAFKNFLSIYSDLITDRIDKEVKEYYGA